MSTPSLVVEVPIAPPGERFSCSPVRAGPRPASARSSGVSGRCNGQVTPVGCGAPLRRDRRPARDPFSCVETPDGSQGLARELLDQEVTTVQRLTADVIGPV